MFVSLDKGNEKGNVVLADFLEYAVCLRYRDERNAKKTEIVLSHLELKAFFKRAIKKGLISKEDL